MIRTDEQTELATVCRDLLRRRSDSAAVRAAMESEQGFDESLWQTLCDQVGVAALAVAEEHGGAGFSLAETCVVLEELGRSLTPTPLLATTLAAVAIERALDDEPTGHSELSAVLERLTTGEVVSLAGGEVTLFGSQAAVVIGYVRGRLTTLDESSLAASETMDPAWPVARTSADVDPWPDDVRDTALVLAAAMQVGVMQRALDDTVAYCRQRVQFGRPIGSFQALKHRMADMLVRLEVSRSAQLHATAGLVSHAPDLADRAAVAAAYCSESLDHIAGEMVQLHGGIAITWEHDAHLVLKRAHALSQTFGQAHEHRARLPL